MGKEETLQTVAGPHLVLLADGYLTVRVQDISLRELLDEIARKSGLTVVRYVALDQRVTLEFHQLSLEQGLRRILRHRSFVLEYAQQTPEKRPSAVARPKTVWILPQGGEKYAVQRRIVESANAGFSGEDIATKISRLRTTLSSEDAEEREEAVVELGESGHAEAVAPLTVALADRNEDVREAAIVSLAEIGGAEAAQALAIALRDEDPRTREGAVDALGEIGGEIAIGLLERALADDKQFVREAAAEMLDELRSSAQ
ncbi:MAG: HEAT repeat domain-containing protein [Acidiferrobacterales bacterium]